MYKVRIIEKTRTTKDGRNWKQKLAIIEKGGKTKFLDLNLSNVCKGNLEREMAIKSLHFPIDVELNDESYFITKNEAGYNKLVITGFVSVNAVDTESWKKEHPLVKKTLDDVFEDDTSFPSDELPELN